MNQKSTFQIYNASAGSGKTFALVREYLKLLLASDYPDTFRQVLAITFTNKAVNEMKERVVTSLREIADESILSSPSDMFLQLGEELRIDEHALHSRAKRVLKRILHNYAFFDISTIDKFNHRLLRTFAHDLGLPVNFEVAVDTVSLLNEAVDRLIYKAGEDKLLTRVLVDFALEKADEDKSWDISLDLKKIARLLLEENHYEHIRGIENKTLADLKALSALLKDQIRETDEQLTKNADAFFALMDANGLEFTDFNGKYIPNFFLKVRNEEFHNLSFGAKWQQEIGNSTLYPKRVAPETATIIDQLQAEIAALFENTETLFFRRQFLRNFRSRLIPLSLLNAINQELNHIKESENLMPISEFNRILAQAITDQPAPFIYERLGEKYRHYFIDEFQDTSEIQWKNLQPLIGNALEGESITGKKGTLLLVGDAKQAIYRWRGGKAEQFIELYNGENIPFQVEPAVEPLPVNYRSYDEIIRFNNRFFRHIAEHLTLPEYRDLYLNNSHQEANTKKGGLVNITFVDKDGGDIREAYCKNTLHKIETLREQGYPLSDICILTRKKDQGALLAGYLQENDIPVISPESLLLKNHPKIDFLIRLMQYLLQPENRETCFQLLSFLAERENEEDKHRYFSSGLRDMQPIWELHDFSPEIFLRRSLYDGIQYAIACFGLNDPSDAYLQYFLDQVLEQANRNHAGPGEFLDHWEKKKDTLGIVAPEGIDAVQIMTIHKSKGLQFPSVIFPFAETSIYDDRDPLLWFPVNGDIFGFPYALVSKNKDLECLSEEGRSMTAEYNAKLELDSFNILYVALTRAVKQLHIIAKNDTDRNGKENIRTFSGLFINFLKAEGLWQEGKTIYEFPDRDAQLPKCRDRQCVSTRKGRETDADYTHYIPYVSNISEKQKFRIVTRSGALWSAGLDEAIETGNVYHSLLSRVFYAADTDHVIREAVAQGVIPSEKEEEFQERITAVTIHAEIGKYYTPAYTIHNEKDIFTTRGETLRPDRIAIDEEGIAVILDYKTGSHDKKYERQLQQYKDVLTQMGYTVRAGYLVFIDRDIRVYPI